jgi:hypothetical protein
MLGVTLFCLSVCTTFLRLCNIIERLQSFSSQFFCPDVNNRKTTEYMEHKSYFTLLYSTAEIEDLIFRCFSLYKAAGKMN